MNALYTNVTFLHANRQICHAWMESNSRVYCSCKGHHFLAACVLYSWTMQFMCCSRVFSQNKRCTFMSAVLCYKLFIYMNWMIVCRNLASKYSWGWVRLCLSGQRQWASSVCLVSPLILRCYQWPEWSAKCFQQIITIKPVYSVKTFIFFMLNCLI